MSRPIYRGFGAGLDPSGLRRATFDMAALPEEMLQAFGGIEPAARLPFHGVTTDGTLVPGLYPIRDTGLSPARLVTAAQAFLAALTPDQRAIAIHPLDSHRRRLWINAFMSYAPHGVLLEEAGAAVRQRALDLIEATMSHKGFQDTRTVMRLNACLGHLIGDQGRNLTEWMYWLTLFGTPSPDEPWGWQLAGHHLDINVTVVGTQLVVTPTFMGAEPRMSDEATGPFAGLRVFDDEEALGLRLIRALSPAQQDRAVLHRSMTDLPGHLAGQWDGRTRGGAGKDNLVLPYEGIPATELDGAQRGMLLDLVRPYAARLPEGYDAVRMAEIVQHLDETWFAWIGSTALENTPFYYKIHSPVVLIEFDHHAGVFLGNVGPERFHAHTLVRTPNGNDYGIDLLRQHHLLFEHTAQGHVPRHGHGHGHGHVHGHDDHHHD